MKTEELVAALRQCGSVGAGCDGCPFENGGAIDAEWCGDALVRAAADRLEGYVDRCKRYADEIMELRERGAVDPGRGTAAGEGRSCSRVLWILRRRRN